MAKISGDKKVKATKKAGKGAKASPTGGIQSSGPGGSKVDGNPTPDVKKGSSKK